MQDQDKQPGHTMFSISEKTYRVITGFLVEWRMHLRAALEATGYNLELDDNVFGMMAMLKNSHIGKDLITIGKAADNKLARTPENIVEVQAALAYVLKMTSDPEWHINSMSRGIHWLTPLVNLITRAWLWVTDDELITVADARKITGKSYSALSQQISRGRFRVFIDLNAPNPQRRRRLLLKSEVLEYAQELQAPR